MSELESDSVRAHDVLDAIFDDCEGLVEVRALPSTDRAFVAIDDLAGVDRFCESRPDQNLFFGAASRRSSVDGSLENCQHLGALFVDIDFKDIDEADARARLAACPCPPGIVIESGGGLHIYWPLKEPAELGEDADETKRLLRRLATYFAGDMSAAECARILRLPGTSNHKYSPPRTVTVQTCEPDRRYNPCDFDDWLPTLAMPQADAAPLSLAEPVVEGHRNATLYRTGRALKAKHLPSGSIATTIRTINAEQCQPPLPTAELERLIVAIGGQPDRTDFNASVTPTTNTPGTRVVPPPSRPMAVARDLSRGLYTDAAGLVLLRSHCGDFYRWNGTCWLEIEDRDVSGAAYRWLEAAHWQHPRRVS